MKESEVLRLIEQRMKIDTLNDMQQQVVAVASSSKTDIILYSPTGSGKTLAFSIPLLKSLKESKEEKLQAVIIVPSRELALQIYEILRVLAVGHKVTCCYGGHNVEDERLSLVVTPSIIVSTPGRLLDHCNRDNIDITNVAMLVLDEFDKSLELGFEDEMKKLVKRMPNLSRRILTSATMIDELPDYLHLKKDYITLNYLVGQQSPKLKS